ncbi:hypothetical protein ABTX62_32660 [Streptomyces sp. NPDC096046]|uniref:hypothetical protein n=1 Tax=Streptomyces sp. NPDC096046 TaxID=3155542 RepID=UPI003329E32B
MSEIDGAIERAGARPEPMPERLQARTMAAVQFSVRARRTSLRRPLWRHDPCERQFRRVHAGCQDSNFDKG